MNIECSLLPIFYVRFNLSDLKWIVCGTLAMNSPSANLIYTLYILHYLLLYD